MKWNMIHGNKYIVASLLHRNQYLKYFSIEGSHRKNISMTYDFHLAGKFSYPEAETIWNSLWKKEQWTILKI